MFVIICFLARGEENENFPAVKNSNYYFENG